MLFKIVSSNILKYIYFLNKFPRILFLLQEVAVLSHHYDDTMCWTWDCMRKKRISKSHWYLVYGKLLKIWMTAQADFKLLCDRKENFGEVEHKLQEAIAFSKLGKKMFGSLQSYVAGAKVGKLVGELFCQWTTAGRVSKQQVEDGIQKITDEACTKNKL